MPAVDLDVIAIIISACALLLTWRNRRTAVRALRLSEAQEDRRKPSLQVRVDDLVGWINADGDRCAGVNIMLTNDSDRDGSVTRVQMNVHFAGDAPGVVQVNPLPSQVPPAQSGHPLDVPQNIRANSSASGWIAFRTRAASTRTPIDNYILVVEDSRGPIVNTVVWPLRELL